MKQDEIEIERLAHIYFQETEAKSLEAENALLEAIYKNKEFVLKIVSKAFIKYDNAAEDIATLKHDAVLNTFRQAKKNFSYDKGNFINYFSFNLKCNTETLLKAQKKRNKKNESLDASIDDKGEVSFVDIIESDTKTEADFIQQDFENKFLEQLLKSINRIYLSTKAGQKNKSAVYTYFVLECLLSKSEEEYKRIFNNYEFLQPQKKIVDSLRLRYYKERYFPTQKDFAAIVGIPETKFTMRNDLVDSIRSDNNLSQIL